MIANLAGTDFPIEDLPETMPPSIVAVVSNSQKVSGRISLVVDTGADLTAIPLPIWLKLFGEPPSTKANVIAENSVGADTKVIVAEISLRIETTDHEIITLSRVKCIVPQDGTPVLGRNVLQCFRLILSRNEILEVRFSSKAKTWLDLED